MYDVVIIGGGIVGLATAYALSEQPHYKLAVIEAEEKLSAHQTGNNSGVIHSGLYYKPGSLKARNCVEGRDALYAFCREYNIPHEQCGKLVVATDENQLPALEKLYQRGIENGLKGLTKLTAEEIKNYEPHVNGKAGLLVRETGIVDYLQVSNAFAGIIKKRGSQIHLGERIKRVVRENGHLRLLTNRGEILTRNLVNCAGLQSDRVARMCGLNPGLRIVPFRGEYYVLKENKYHLVKNLIYPVPDPQFPFLGVHFTRMIDGRREAGPNAVLAFKREGYSKWSFSLRDSLSTVLYPGFFFLAIRYWRMGLGEYYRSFSKRAFVRALQRLIPEVSENDVVPGGAGVRAQAMERSGFLVDDFRIIEAEGMIHVLNAPSPAATACISIGRKIAGLSVSNFNLS